MFIPTVVVCNVRFRFLLFSLPPCRNEREGIPVPIIHLLDNCVEIPQLGMVRSLNAHVSGAILVWEYVKEHLVEKNSRTTTTLDTS